jgi:glycosyltransferase involved in cell wall biosynthesis
MRCRILYLVGQLGPGGLERQLCCLLRVMDRERYQPVVVVWNFHEDDIYVRELHKLGVTLHSFADAGSALAKLRGFCSLIRQLQPELVHSYSFYTNFAAFWATWGTQTVAVGALRSDFARAKEDSGWWLGSLSARWPCTQISNSFSAAEMVRRSRSVFAPRRLFVVRNGVDLQQFRSMPPSDGKMVHILGIGSLLPVKRWDRLLEAAHTLKGRGFDFLVRIVGDGPLRGSLRQQTEGLGIEDRVEFLGYSDDIPGLLANATFLVHTSDSEGCPNVVMEAMACGRPVVATDAGDVPSLIQDGQTGFVVPRGDDATLAIRIATLITDRELCRRMGEAGLAKAKREFGVDRLVSETFVAYHAAGWKDS